MKIKESLFRSLAALVLAAAMLGASVCAYADEGGSRYEDVQPDDWFYDAVEHCAKYDSPLCLIEDPVHSRIDTDNYGKSSLFYPERTFTFDPAVRDICMLHHVLSKMSDGYITPSNADKSDYIFYKGTYATAFGLYDTFVGEPTDSKTPIPRAAFISLLYSAVPVSGGTAGNNDTGRGYRYGPRTNDRSVLCCGRPLRDGRRRHL